MITVPNQTVRGRLHARLASQQLAIGFLAATRANVTVANGMRLHVTVTSNSA